MSTIYRLLERHRITGDVSDRRRSGRPRVTSVRRDRFIRLTHLRNRFQSAAATSRQTRGLNNRRISVDTVRRRLRNAGLRARRPYCGPGLTRRHRAERLRWCRNNVNRRLRDWHDMLFSDESRFCVDHADGRFRVYRRTGERYADACVMEQGRLGGANIMVWGGIAYGERTQLVVLNFQDNGPGRGLTARRYIDQVLRPHVVPFFAQHPGYLFQQDNARAHSAFLTQNFLQANGIHVLDWPALFPDLAPIEHLWDELGRRIHNRRRQPTNVNELQAALRQEWNNMPQAFINRLVNSMRRRCTAVVNADGGHTRY